MDVFGYFNYWVVVVLMMTGFYVIMARRNLVKKILGLNVFQAAVILMYVSMGKVSGGTAAILVGGHGGGHDAHGGDGHGGGHDAHGGDGHGASDAAHGATDAHAVADAHDAGHGVVEAAHGVADAAHAAAPVLHEVMYSNPLPHVLMLTAIVVGVATTALGLALVVRIQEAYGTIEEDEIRKLDQGELP
jgi:multicomponent Na+:H+ antiporter subunit C